VSETGVEVDEVDETGMDLEETGVILVETGIMMETERDYSVRSD